MSARHAVTIGHGAKSSKTYGNVITCPESAEPVAWLRGLLSESKVEDVDGWWSGAEFSGSPVASGNGFAAHRNGDHWQSQSAFVIDLDYHNENANHDTPPPQYADAIRAAVLEVELPASLAYFTPRGVRLIAVLDAPERSRDRAERALRGYAALVRAALYGTGLMAEPIARDRGRKGFMLDDQSEHISQAQTLPNATRKGTPRTSQVFLLTSKPFSVDALLEHAPAVEERKPIRVSGPPPDLKRLGPYVRKVITSEVERVATTRASRNCTLASAAFSIGTLLGALGPDGEAMREEVAAYLLDASYRNGDVAEDGERKSADTIRRCIARGIAHPRVLPDQKWEPPIPLDGEPDLPDFPSDVLPASLRAYVEGLSEELQVPAGLCGPVVLAAFSAALNNKLHVQVTDTWTEGVNLYTAAVMRSGGGKSPAFSAITAPLQRYQRSMIDNARHPIAEAKAERAHLEERLKHVQKSHAAAVNNSDSGAAALLEERKRLTRLLEDHVIPAEPRVFTEDCTPERLVTLLHEQQERLAVLSSEAEPFSLMSRYEEGGRFNFDAYLKGWNRESLIQDRMGRERAILEHPSLVLAVTVQPSVLKDIADTRTTLRSRGFLGRVLWIIPPDLIGRRNMRPRSMPSSVREEYEGAVKRALELDTDKEPIALSPAARECFIRFEEEIEPDAAEYGRLGHMSDYLSKLRGNTLRLAALLHGIDGVLGLERGEAMPHEVGEDAMQRAVRLARFFLVHAEVAYSRMSTDQVEPLAAKVLGWITHRGRGTFTRRLAQRHVLGGRSDEAGLLDDALRMLEEHLYIREQTGTDDKKQTGTDDKKQTGTEDKRPRRRDSHVYTVSPWIIEPEQDQTDGAEVAEAVAGGVT